ncbi:uncharacterized protein EAE98_000275 [Botrytis deweyae]|uniref:Uncharacterized protein n=1 Tax=Botrytis deweyae TaxID=2478750 RepID=A0ABQ7J2G5_9HELO|nr:uncharacterized protein EAE98_000275 [Botrytis deweyae]KAF7940148.1 hypothetical protein EAE98_000275 [Botrytis deweyae]
MGRSKSKPHGPKSGLTNFRRQPHHQDPQKKRPSPRRNRWLPPPHHRTRHFHNGQDEHEDFKLTQYKSVGFNFCKTARKEYDAVVATILMRAKVLAGDGFSLFSDGDWDDEWQRTLKDYVKLWPIEEKPTGNIFDPE